MYNLLIHSNSDFWDANDVNFPRDRFTEYTVPELKNRYGELTEKVIEELKGFPCLFMIEGDTQPSRIGKLESIKVREKELRISYSFDKTLPQIQRRKIGEISNKLDITEWELGRTHWAIKDVDLSSVLLSKNVFTENEIQKSSVFSIPEQLPENKPSDENLRYNSSQIFIVHGHDNATKLKVSDFVESLGLEPIILHLKPNSGLTIIEKIEKYTNVGFGLILYTPCDIGAKRDSIEFARRARQNVVFEHGYLIAKLGRKRVAALVKKDVEVPNDISGMVYIELDEVDENWKDEIVNELRELGYQVTI